MTSQAAHRMMTSGLGFWTCTTHHTAHTSRCQALETPGSSVASKEAQISNSDKLLGHQQQWSTTCMYHGLSWDQQGMQLCLRWTHCLTVVQQQDTGRTHPTQLQPDPFLNGQEHPMPWNAGGQHTRCRTHSLMECPVAGPMPRLLLHPTPQASTSVSKVLTAHHDAQHLPASADIEASQCTLTWDLTQALTTKVRRRLCLQQHKPMVCSIIWHMQQHVVNSSMRGTCGSLLLGPLTLTRLTPTTTTSTTTTTSQHPCHTRMYSLTHARSRSCSIAHI